MKSKPKKPRKNRAAQALVRLRWANATAEDKQKLREAGKLGGRPRSKDRCPCGKFTRDRAAKRNHKCTGPQELLPQPFALAALHDRTKG